MTKTRTPTLEHRYTTLNLVPEAVVRLRNEWADLEIEKDDCLNIIRANSKIEHVLDSVSDDRIIDIGDDYYVVLHPDLLLSPSRVSQSFPCLRRGLLSEWLRSGQRSRKTLLGQMKHELFEQCLRAHDFSSEHVMKVCREILSNFKFMSELCAVDETSESKVRSNRFLRKISFTHSIDSHLKHTGTLGNET